MPELKTLPIGLIDEPPLPVRAQMDDAKLAELAQSIRDIGLLSPIMVADDGGRYHIITGHRRFIAMQMIAAPRVPCFVYPPDYKHELAAMVAENACREDVNAAEEAIWFHQLVEQHQYTEEMLMQLTHRSADYIGDRFRLLRGDELVFAAVQRAEITHSTARELNKCDNAEMRRYFLDAAIRGGQASRHVRKWIDDWRVQATPASESAPVETAPVADAPVEVTKIECAACGGSKDPWNLIHITIHRWEWEQLLSAMKEAAHAER